MKRVAIFVLILCLATNISYAEETKSVWDSIGGWFGQAAEDTGNWFTQAWTDVSSWVGGAWGDASKWVENTWNDSSRWVTDIWGDVSTWATNTYDSASSSIATWWTDTFAFVTGNSKNAWEWISKEAESLTDEIAANLKTVKDAVSAEGTNAKATVEEAIYTLLEKLNLSRDDSKKILDTLEIYAAKKGLDILTVQKLVLPYIFQLTVDNAKTESGIPAIAVAQYLTGIIEKLGVDSVEKSNTLVQQLTEVLGTF